MPSPNETRIRPATEADDARVGEFLVDTFVRVYAQKRPDFEVTEGRRAELRNMRKHRAAGHVLVCENGTTLLGTVTVFKHGTNGCHAWLPTYSELRFLAVSPDYHGAGISASLMEAAEAQCRDWQSEGIAIHIRKGLAELARFYERRGFRRDPRGDKAYDATISLEGYSLSL